MPNFNPASNLFCKKFIFHLSSFIFILTACATPTPLPPLSTTSSLFVFDFASSSILQFSNSLNLENEFPLQLPCPLTQTYPAPRGQFLALEMQCDNGPLVQILDVNSDAAQTPFTDVDSHFLTWDAQSNLYLRVDALGDARVMRVAPNRDSTQTLLPAQTYDMDSAPDGLTLTFTFSRGLGLGSELWAGSSTLSRTWQLHSDAHNIITFARWSPNGRHIAFIRMPDSATPFPLGELWVMDSAGTNPRLLAPADSGHGYAATWSDDSTRLAFVGRDNPNGADVEQSASALLSNIYIVDIASGAIMQVTHFSDAIVETPVWSADGHFLAFSVVHSNDTISVWVVMLASGEMRPIESRNPLCCPGWLRK